MNEKIFEIDKNGVPNNEGVRQLIQNLQQQNRALILDRDRYAAMLNETRDGLQNEVNECRRIKDIEIMDLKEKIAHIESLRSTHQSLVNELQNVRENLVAARRRIADLTDEKKSLEKRVDTVEGDERRYYEAWQSAALRNAEMLNEIRALWRTYIPDWTPAAAIRAGDMLNPAWQPLAERLSFMDGLLASAAITSVVNHDTMLGVFPAEDIQ